jgi:DNA-binding response OmpR family regulator
MSTAATNILLVEDEQPIRESVQAYLRNEGYAVTAVENGRRALEVFAPGRFELIILDLMLPEISGEVVAKAIRNESDIPIIMLTGKVGIDARILGLEQGADDYLEKPFSPRELMARVRVLLRRVHANQEPQRDRLDFDGLSIDVPSRSVQVDGQDVKLTHSEFDLLLTLARYPGRVFARMDLVKQILGYDYEGYERTIDSHMKNLRSKLGEDIHHPRWIYTVHGVGYRFLLPDKHF